MKNIEELSSVKFAAIVSDFLDGKPSKRNGLSTVRALLFMDSTDNHYVWYALGAQDVVEDVIDHSMSKKFLVPVGVTYLVFETRDTGRIHLSKDIESYIDERFDADEVLNATIPYFMRDLFGYKLDAVKITDLGKN
jgi:hypothetical protein